MSKIVVVGSLNIDLVVSVARRPEQGETITGTGFKIVPGGKGANQAYAAAQAGAQVSMVGRLGEDTFANILEDSLSRVGVDTAHILRTEGVATGTALITVCDGDNTIILDPGSNGMLSAKDVEKVDKLLLEADAIMMQMEVPLEVNNYLIQNYKGKTKLFFNPAPMKEFPLEWLDGLDFIIPNEIEAKQLSGIEIQSEQDAFAVLDWFLEKKVKYPLITLGEKGVAVFTGEEKVVIPARKVKAVDTSAAGDTFAGMFTRCVCEGMSIAQAVVWAQAASSITVTQKGAQSSIPSYAMVERLMQNETHQ